MKNRLIRLIFSIACLGVINKIIAQDKLLSIEIVTKDSCIIINKNKIKEIKKEVIQNLLGTPDRIRTDTIHTYMEEFGFDGHPPTTFPVVLYQRFYIYDKLGIMFSTDKREYSIGNIEYLYIFSHNKRKFNNVKPPTFAPKNYFSGTLIINAIAVDFNQTIIPVGTNYWSDGFAFNDVSFGLTSIGGKIDGLYSKNTDPYILIYLESEENQRISYLTVKM